MCNLIVKYQVKLISIQYKWFRLQNPSRDSNWALTGAGYRF